MKFLNPTITAAVVLFYLPFLTSSFSNNNNYFLKTALRINTRIHAVVGSSSSNSNSSTSSNAQPLPPAITIDDVTCSHDGGTTYQLQNVNYVLPRGAKIGLVGRNGCGKSTLLKILAESTVDAEIGKGGGSGGKNVINKDEGVVYTGCIEKGKGCRVAYVEQEPAMPSDITVADALLGITTAPGAVGSLVIDGKKNVFSAVRAYRLTAKNAEQDPRAFAEATSNMEVLDGWTVLTKADEVATKLRVKHLENSPLSTLSGGERKRVALASALIQDPDVLLLDEPTNHLDLSAIQWLSDLIKDRPKITLLTVTHDRAFLEDVCDTILELDRGSLYTYQGNYANFLEKKAERLANEDAEIQSAKAKYAVELDWMRRQPQARATKQKARIDAFYKLEKATKPRVVDPNLVLGSDGQPQRRLGNNVLKLKNVSLKFGNNRVILDDFSYNFNRGDKIGIVGANGVGKSTFIKILTGQQPIDSGEIELGETVVFGVYDQMGIDIDGNKRVLEFMKERVEARDGTTMAEAPQEAMKLLKQFNFDRNRWNERVSMLSGGERRRLQLMSVLTKRPNFLVLDEPTNDIDLDTLTALEQYLDEYQGVLVIVSHDRYFTDKVTDHLFVFEGNGVVKDFTGTLSDYAECLVDIERSSSSSSSSSSSGKDVAVKSSLEEDKKVTYREDKQARMQRSNQLKKDKKEMNALETKMEKLKEEVVALEAKIEASSNEGWTVLAELTDKLNSIKQDIENKELRWLELAEAIEQAEAES